MPRPAGALAFALAPPFARAADAGPLLVELGLTPELTNIILNIMPPDTLPPSSSSHKIEILPMLRHVRCDLLVNIMQRGDGTITASIYYSVHGFDPSTIARMFQRYTAILELIPRNVTTLVPVLEDRRISLEHPGD